jgi:nucleotide-binding universal stress UspA family protein
MGVKVETHLATGTPAKMIIKTVQDLGAELVVVGSKKIERKIRRSVPSSVSQAEDRDIVIVRTTPARDVRRDDFGRRRRASERRQTPGALARSGG